MCYHLISTRVGDNGGKLTISRLVCHRGEAMLWSKRWQTASVKPPVTISEGSRLCERFRTYHRPLITPLDSPFFGGAREHLKTKGKSFIESHCAARHRRFGRISRDNVPRNFNQSGGALVKDCHREEQVALSMGGVAMKEVDRTTHDAGTLARPRIGEQCSARKAPHRP